MGAAAVPSVFKAMSQGALPAIGKGLAKSASALPGLLRAFPEID